MKKKYVCKIIIDMLMTVLLLLLMARQFTGDSAHEWIGAGMLALWAAHHILNRNWYSHFFKGQYTPMRIFQTLVNFFVLLSMFGLMVSGLILSREVFAFLLFFTEYIAIMGLFVLLLLSALLPSGCGSRRKTDAEHTAGVFAMGTYMTLTGHIN